MANKLYSLFYRVRDSLFYISVNHKNMQDVKKEIVFKAIAKTVKKLRGEKSQFLLGAEYDIPSSVLSDLERAVKDPQLTTLLKLANAFDLSISKFMEEFEKELPENFNILED